MGGPTGMQQACLLRCFWSLPVNSLPWEVAQGHCGMGHITSDPTRNVKEFLTAGFCRVLQRLGKEFEFFQPWWRKGCRRVRAWQRDTASEAQPSVPCRGLAGLALFGVLFPQPSFVDVVEDSDDRGHRTQLLILLPSPLEWEFRTITKVRLKH